MGVFAWFRRKGGKTAEAATGAADTTAAAGPEERTGESAEAGGTEVRERPEEAAEAATAETAPGEPDAAEPAGKSADGEASEESADGVEIPRQQSAGDAVDNGAGEGARA
ncbi:hypothetical protein LUX01_05075 [Streptomyces sudanensis]|uniref:hypothetical protein n=1 Tax=Streptomyces sudanensis TaxID=436397 RepID=UPI0020CC5B4C|nr:hypothetical protein [Streptomyces sudanensis]MCP9986186.1 hypothetical protein [Streptomyces sudanensis]